MKRLLFLQKQPFPYMGVLSMAGYLRAVCPQVEIGVVVAALENDVAAAAAAWRPDLVAVSALSTEHSWLGRELPRVKALTGAPIILGGLHASLYYAECLRDIPALDAACFGDGEYVLRDCLNASDPEPWRHVRGCAVRDSNAVRLNPPYPLYDVALVGEWRELYYTRYPVLAAETQKQFIATRGCAWRCAYCHNGIFRDRLREVTGSDDRYRRRKPAAAFVREIAAVVSRYPTRTLFFADDNFLEDGAWLAEFAPLYRREIGLPYMAIAISEYVTDAKAALLRMSGCRHVEIGLETANEHVRHEVLGRKGSNAAISAAIQTFHRHGLGVVTANMHLIPGAGPRDFRETVEFNVTHKVEYAKASLLLPFPGTVLEQTCLQRGALARPLTLAELPQGFFFRSVLRLPGQRRLLRLHKLFSWMIWLPRLRHLLYHLTILPLPLIADAFFVAGIIRGYQFERGLKISEALTYFWRFRRSR